MKTEQIVLRVPADVKRQLEQIKRRQHISINQQVQQAIQRWLAEHDIGHHRSPARKKA